MKKKYFLWIVLIFLLLNFGCSKPKVIFENEYIRTYENNKDLKAWYPDWQEGEFWTVNILEPIITISGSSEIENPVGIAYFNIKYSIIHPKRIRVKEKHQNKEKYINRIRNCITMIINGEKGKKILFRAFFNNDSYKFYRLDTKENEEWNIEQFGSQHPFIYDKIPLRPPIYPANLQQKYSEIEILTYKYETKLSGNDKLIVKELYNKRDALDIIQSSYRFPPVEVDKLKKKYPELSNLTNDEANKIHDDIHNKIREIEDKYPLVKIPSSIYIQEIRLIDFNKLNEDIYRTEFLKTFKVYESTKNNKNEIIEFNLIKKGICDDLLKIQKERGLGIIFIANFYIKRKPESQRELLISQIWSTNFNWPIITKVYSGNKLKRFSFLKLD